MVIIIVKKKEINKVAPRALLSYISTSEFLRTLKKCEKHLPSAGVSLHFSRVLKNSHMLTYITLQCNWSAFFFVNFFFL